MAISCIGPDPCVLLLKLHPPPSGIFKVFTKVLCHRVHWPQARREIFEFLSSLARLSSTSGNQQPGLHYTITFPGKKGFFLKTVPIVALTSIRHKLNFKIQCNSERVFKGYHMRKQAISWLLQKKKHKSWLLGWTERGHLAMLSVVKTNVNLLLLFQSASFHQGQKEHSRKTKTIHLLKRRQIQEHSGIPKSLGVKMHRPVFCLSI